MAIKELLTFKNKAKYVTEEDITRYKKGFNRDVSLLERCILGMKKFAEELPKMVNECAEIIESNKKKEEMNNQSRSNASNRPNNRPASNASNRSNSRPRSNASNRSNSRSRRRSANKPRSRSKRWTKK